MSVLWTGFLEVFQIGLFWITQFYGGHLAAAIISFSLLTRVLLLPLTVRMTLRVRRHSRQVRGLQPELARVRSKWEAENPEKMVQETMAVYHRHGVRPFDAGMLKGSLLQAPIFIGLYRAVQNALSSHSGTQGFLWVKDLARPDLGVAVVASVLVGLGSISGASQTQPAWATILPVIASFAMAMMFSSGFAFYLGSSGLETLLQGLLVRRVEARAEATI